MSVFWFDYMSLLWIELKDEKISALDFDVVEGFWRMDYFVHHKLSLTDWVG